MRIRYFILLLLFLFCRQGLAQQQSTAPKKTAKKKSVETQQTDTRQQGERIFLDKIEILGKIEKPQTVFILPGKDPMVDDIEIDRSFFKEIFRPVEYDSFKPNKELVDSIKKIE